MLNCGKKKNRKKADLSNVGMSKMAEAIEDDVNNSNHHNKSNIAIIVSDADGNNSGNGDANTCCDRITQSNHHRTAANAPSCNLSRNPTNRRSIQRFSCSRCCNDIFNYLMRFRASPEELEQRYKSREIDRFLEKDKHTFRRQVNTKMNGVNGKMKCCISSQNNDRDSDFRKIF